KPPVLNELAVDFRTWASRQLVQAPCSTGRPQGHIGHFHFSRLDVDFSTAFEAIEALISWRSATPAELKSNPLAAFALPVVRHYRARPYLRAIYLRWHLTTQLH